MTTLGIVALALLLALVGLVVGMQAMVRMRAKALTGKPLPQLPGSLEAQVSGAERALVYFFSPGCAACRTITPRMRKMSADGAPVFVIDVMESLDVARALGIMATPSTVEIAAGKVVAFHVGPVPDEVMARFR